MCTRTFICNSSPRDVSTDNSFVFETVRNKPAAKERSGESGRERTELFTHDVAATGYHALPKVRAAH